MNKPKWISFLTVFLGGFGLSLNGMAETSFTHVPVWNRWETSFTSTMDYQKPAKDVVLSVDYTGPEGLTIHGYGFWDREKTFKIRCLFPKAGTWEWRTECSDPGNTGLHRQQGTIQVTPYDGSNPLYQRGYIRISADSRYLEHNDGTPFLWIGDTAWAAPMNATFDEWKTYIQDRRAKNFSVIQIFCACRWAAEQNIRGIAPFLEKDISRLNPDYWQDYENLVQYANEQGMVIAIVGLMEPLERYPNAEDARVFARNLVSRLMGNFVIFSPSFDSSYTELGDVVGEEIRKTTPIHLITQHPGTHLPTMQQYYDKNYLSFCGLQSGAGWGTQPISADKAAENAIEWSLGLYNRIPPKPIINMESRYDSTFNQEQLARLPRSCGYSTLLVGAKGYTYGCSGVWFWGKPAFVGEDPQSDPTWNLQTGMQKPSSTHMKYMAEIFGSLAWWKLEPAQGLILNQEEPFTQKMVLSISPDYDLAVAYLPNNERIEIQLADFPQAMNVRWWNPQTGQFVEGEKTKKNTTIGLFQRPEGWEDAVLVLSSQPFKK